MPITIVLKTDSASLIHSPQSDSMSQMRHAAAAHTISAKIIPLSRMWSVSDLDLLERKGFATAVPDKLGR